MCVYVCICVYTYIYIYMYIYIYIYVHIPRRADHRGLSADHGLPQRACGNVGGPALGLRRPPRPPLGRGWGRSELWEVGRCLTEEDRPRSHPGGGKCRDGRRAGDILRPELQTQSLITPEPPSAAFRGSMLACLGSATAEREGSGTRMSVVAAITCAESFDGCISATCTA